MNKQFNANSIVIVLVVLDTVEVTSNAGCGQKRNGECVNFAIFNADVLFG